MVMGLLALILGFGVGAIASVDLGTSGTGSLVRSTMRSASNWSRSRQAPSRVFIDTKRGKMSAEGLAVVGTWHFETMPPKGAFGLDGQIVDAELIDSGFVGRALSFVGAPAQAAYEIPVHTDPAFNLLTGFQIQLFIRPETQSTGRVLQMGEAVRMEATSRGGLRVQVATQRYDEDTGRAISAGAAMLDTPPGILTTGIWNRVLVNYDRKHLEVYVEGLLVASLEEEGDVVPIKSMMRLGGGERPWGGSLDGLVISAVGASEEVSLPEGVSFGEGTPTDIHFAADGGLDRGRHDEPILIPVEYDDGRRETVRVNMYGTVE